MTLKLVNIDVDEGLYNELNVRLSPFINGLFKAIEKERITSKIELGVYIGKCMVNLIDFLIEGAFNGNAEELIVGVLGIISSYAESKGITIKKLYPDAYSKSSKPAKKPSEPFFVAPGNNLEN